MLHRWSLDELPQLFNVLNRTMSLMGPRPHTLDHISEFVQRSKDYFVRDKVKGFRRKTDSDEKLEGRIHNAIFHAQNWSLSLYLQILVRTVSVGLFRKNAY